MRIYARDEACGFRFSRAAWGAFSNFQPLAVPIAAGPWLISSSESLYQSAKFAARPDIQQRIAAAPTAREAATLGRTSWPRHRPRLERPARPRHALGSAHEARGQPGPNRRAAVRHRRPPHRRGFDARPLVGRAARRRPLRGQECPRTPLDGTPPAPSRERSGGPLRRLGRPHPRRPPGRPRRRCGYRPRSRLSATSRQPHTVSPARTETRRVRAGPGSA